LVNFVWNILGQSAFEVARQRVESGIKGLERFMDGGATVPVDYPLDRLGSLSASRSLGVNPASGATEIQR
jgi:hypothetical protein